MRGGEGEEVKEVREMGREEVGEIIGNKEGEVGQMIEVGKGV